MCLCRQPSFFAYHFHSLNRSFAERWRKKIGFSNYFFSLQQSSMLLSSFIECEGKSAQFKIVIIFIWMVVFHSFPFTCHWNHISPRRRYVHSLNVNDFKRITAKEDKLRLKENYIYHSDGKVNCLARSLALFFALSCRFFCCCLWKWRNK